MTISQAIAARMNELMKEKNLSVLRLARESQISTSYLYDLLKAKPKTVRMRVIHRLCLGLGITVAEFFRSPFFVNMD